MSTTKQAVRNELLTGAMVVGLLLSIVELLSFVSSFWLGLILSVGVYVWGQLYYGRRVAQICIPEQGSYSYLSSWGFSIKMALLATVVVGVTRWLVIGVWFPEVGAEMAQQSALAAVEKLPNPTAEQIVQIGTVARAMVGLWGVVLWSMFFGLLNGGGLGLITSAFIQIKEAK